MATRLFQRAPWQARAACRGVGPAAFYPEVGAKHVEIAAAKSICAACPVSAECEAAGKAEKHGIWGGSTVDDRRGRVKVAS